MNKLMLMMGIGLLTTDCVFADVLPLPKYRRPKPVVMKPEPPKPEPVLFKTDEPKEPKGEEKLMTATMYGRLIYLDNIATSSINYALCRKVGDKWVPVCYIKTEIRLGHWKDHDLRVTGFVSQPKGWSCPVLLLEYPENFEEWPPKPKEQVDIVAPKIEEPNTQKEESDNQK